MPFKAISGIYLIRNNVNFKIYIGSSVSLKKRLNQHNNRLNLNVHENTLLQNSWNKYGENNFEFSVLEECRKGNLVEREQYYIDLFKSYKRHLGFNIALKAFSCLGIKRSDEFKKKCSLRHRGKVLSIEHKEKLINSRKGKINSLEHNKRISEFGKTRIYTKETRLKMSLAKKGKPLTEKQKLQLSKARIGNKSRTGFTKFSFAQIDRIRWFYNDGMTQRNIAIMFKCNHKTIADIIHKRRFAYREVA